MSLPRDFLDEHRIGLVKLARIYSNVVSPPTIFATLGIIFALKERPFWPGMGWAAVYGLLVSLAPILVVIYLLRTGKIEELHMSNTRERTIPYIAAIVCAALAFTAVYLFNGPDLLRCLALFNIIELTALALINRTWLISIHATGAMAAFVLVGLIWNWVLSLLAVMPIVISVFWVRLYLKRHSPAQIIAGGILGIVSVWVMGLFGCFV